MKSNNISNFFPKPALPSNFIIHINGLTIFLSLVSTTFCSFRPLPWFIFHFFLTGVFHCSHVPQTHFSLSLSFTYVFIILFLPLSALLILKKPTHSLRPHLNPISFLKASKTFKSLSLSLL